MIFLVKILPLSLPSRILHFTCMISPVIPVLAEEKEIPYVYLATKDKVGAAAGLSVGTASACIVDAGDAADLVAEVVEKVAELKE